MTIDQINELKDTEFLKEPKRHVGFAFTVNYLQDVSDKDQTFDMRFVLQLEWEAKCDGDSFYPNLIWGNSVDMQSIGEQEWQPAIGYATKGQIVRVTQYFQAQFSEPYEMRWFPHDYQKLHIVLESDPVEEIKPGKLDTDGAILANWQIHKNIDR